MRALIYATGQDTGGQGWRIRQSFGDDPEWHVDTLAASPSPLAYPEQYPVTLPERARLAADLYVKADVVHLRNNLSGWERFDNGRHCKPIVLHHHGTLFRNGHRAIAAQARAIGAVQLAATLDLTLLEPGVEWMPSPYNIDQLAGMRQRTDGPIRIGYFPTNARVKSARQFMAAFRRLADANDVELVTNMGKDRPVWTPWHEVLAAKATCDIYFDQVLLGYGNNAIEAWGMGIPVVAGTKDPQVRSLMVKRFGRVPFVEADEDSIYDVLRSLVKSEAMREDYGELGREHARRFHDGKVVVQQLKAVYAAAQPTHRPAVDPRRLIHEERRQAVRERNAARKVERLELRRRLREVAA